MFEFLFESNPNIEFVTEFTYEGNYGDISGYAVVHLKKECVYRVYYISYRDGDDIENVNKSFKGDYYEEDDAIEYAKYLFDDLVR